MLPHSQADFFICSVILTTVRRDFGVLVRLSNHGNGQLLTGTLSLALLLGGCAVAPSLPPRAGGGSDLALSAVGLVGVPYRYGGDDPSSGFDCSGLVQFVTRSVLGIHLPRQVEAISKAGFEVDPLQLQPGDLVFFNTLGRPYSHVGVYLGDDQFVHAPTLGGNVRIERMSQTYWRARFDGARRVHGALD
jgi:cell wall-associated NlpC family hydrolase